MSLTQQEVDVVAAVLKAVAGAVAGPAAVAGVTAVEGIVNAIVAVVGKESVQAIIAKEFAAADAVADAAETAKFGPPPPKVAL